MKLLCPNCKTLIVLTPSTWGASLPVLPSAAKSSTLMTLSLPVNSKHSCRKSNHPTR